MSVFSIRAICMLTGDIVSPQKTQAFAALKADSRREADASQAIGRAPVNTLVAERLRRCTSSLRPHILSHATKLNISGTALVAYARIS